MCLNLMAGTTLAKKDNRYLVAKCHVMAKKNVTPNLLQLCDECMEENSQLIMYAN